MFGNEPWHTEFGPARRWHWFGLPTFLVVGIALVWLLQYGGLVSSLAEWFLTPEGDTTLKLPDDLVLARLPWSYTWNADLGSDDVLLSLFDQADPTRPFVLERWSRPWKEGKREPIPAVWRVATQPEWQNDTALVCHFGLNGPLTRDRSLMAAMYHPSERAPQTRIIALSSGREIARVDAIPAGANGKCITWHPTDKILAIGSYGSVTLVAAPDWKARKLAAAARDRIEWERRVQEGTEESGYYPNENVSQLLFSDDGTLLITAMDRGVRIYDWQEVCNAKDRLPAPRHAVDGVLVRRPIASFKMTFAVAYDARRRHVLWSENDGKLKSLDLNTGEQTTLLTLSNRYCVTRLHLCAAGDALICEIVRMGKSNNGPCALVVLDYPKLLPRDEAARDPHLLGK
jgi:hypothetical protein